MFVGGKLCVCWGTCAESRLFGRVRHEHICTQTPHDSHTEGEVGNAKELIGERDLVEPIPGARIHVCRSRWGHGGRRNEGIWRSQ